MTMTPEEINLRLDTELKHAASKEDVALLKSDLQRELAVNTRWLIGTMIALQVPTWIGMVQLWVVLKH